MEFEKLQEIIAGQLSLEPDEISADSLFVDDLGADSLDVFQIVMMVEKEFDMVIDEEKAEKIKNVEDLIMLLK